MPRLWPVAAERPQPYPSIDTHTISLSFRTNTHLFANAGWHQTTLRPEFGCAIHDYVFAGADAATAGLIAAEVRAALRRWEPRIDVHDVSVSFDSADPSTLYIDIQYVPKDTNDRRNLVFPFYTIPEDGSDY